MTNNKFILTLVSGLLIVMSTCVGVSDAQIASALIREGDTLPGDSSGFLIRDINPNTAQNGVGGSAFNVETFDAAGTGSIFHYWGNTTSGSGTVLRTQSTFGNFEQNRFVQFGMSDAGTLAYRARSANTVTGTTGLYGTWVDSTLILNEEDPIPTLPGNFSVNNFGVDITRGGTPYWVGQYSTTQGGSSTGSAIFYGADLTVLLASGDSVGGVTETVAASGSAIDGDLRFSANGSNYLTQVLVDSGSVDNDGVMVSNGSALFAGGSVIREGTAVPTSIGGLGGELYDNFDRFGITESGSYLITGNTDAATLDEFIMIDGQIILREGDMIDGLTLNGAIESAFLNEDGDWSAVWDVDVGTDNLEALIVNGEIVLLEGDLVDWNNDGIIDGADQNGFITNFTSGIRGLALSDRDANGNIRILFEADIDFDGTFREGGFSMTYAAAAVPEPSSFVFGSLALIGILIRRRRSV